MGSHVVPVHAQSCGGDIRLSDETQSVHIKGPDLDLSSRGSKELYGALQPLILANEIDNELHRSGFIGHSKILTLPL